MSRLVVLKASPEALAKLESPRETSAPVKKPSGRKKAPKKLLESTDDALPRNYIKSSAGSGTALLRGLDTSGKPCRKWVKSPVEVKSFTQTVFTVNTWTGEKSMESIPSSPVPAIPASAE